MGQYYRPVLQIEDKPIEIYDRDIDGEYTMAKLMEHSWWRNNMVNAILYKLLDKQCKLAWVGDYAEDLPDDIAKLNVWDKEDCEKLTSVDFTLDGCFVYNHTKQQYLDCDKYKSNNADGDGWIINPMPLLTAFGNGLGGGDYDGENEDLVGSWAWDTIEITRTKKDNDYEELEITFKEEY